VSCVRRKGPPTYSDRALFTQAGARTNAICCISVAKARVLASLLHWHLGGLKAEVRVGEEVVRREGEGHAVRADPLQSGLARGPRPRLLDVVPVPIVRHNVSAAIWPRTSQVQPFPHRPSSRVGEADLEMW